MTQTLIEKLRDAFQRKRYGNPMFNDSIDYDPDYDLFDAAADAIAAQSKEMAAKWDEATGDGYVDTLKHRLSAAETRLAAQSKEMDSLREALWKKDSALGQASFCLRELLPNHPDGKLTLAVVDAAKEIK